MVGLFDGTPLQRPVTCERCSAPLAACRCPRNASGVVLLPQDQSPRVQREKRGGKMVTVIRGLDPKANDLAGMLKTLRSSLGTGGTLDKATGQLELQGDHRDRLVADLISKGYRAKAAGG